MSLISDMEDEIVEGLLQEFELPKPKITSDLNFAMSENEDKLITTASRMANSANAGTAIFVCFTGVTSGEKKASGLIYPYWYFTILIMAKNRRKTEFAHSDI